MAITRKPPEKPQAVSIYLWTKASSKQSLKLAFRRPSEWVVSDSHEWAGWYSAVLGNLNSQYVEPAEATVDYVRNALLKGFKRNSFDRLKSVIGTAADDLSQVVGIPPRTLLRREIFKPDESERILRVAAAIQRALEVMGNLDTARHWFTSPKRALGDQTPLHYCDTDMGAREVMNLLGRIEHGVFS